MALLEAKNISISFGGLDAVKNVSINVDKDQIYGLIGPNGAGKTTIFNLLTGVYKPLKGKIKLDSQNITGQGQVAISKAGIARTFQNIRLFSNLSVIDNVKVAMHNRYQYNPICSIFKTAKYIIMENDMNKEAMELLKVFELDEEAHLKASNLSYGNQRKLEIARALATKPKVLLLDEPAAGMNNHETAELMDTIRFIKEKFDVAILLIEHDMKLVSGICGYIYVLNFGEMLKYGDTSEVLNDPEVIKAYLGD